MTNLPKCEGCDGIAIGLSLDPETPVYLCGECADYYTPTKFHTLWDHVGTPPWLEAWEV